MIIVRQEDLLHKFQLLKLLTIIVDNPFLSQSLYFKGGTAAAMAGFLDRFSVDLDFDLKSGVDKVEVRKEIERVFTESRFEIENDNQETLFYALKYKAPQNQRNTLKISTYESIVRSNDYKPIYLSEIDRLVSCQTIETMFANKLVALTDRFNKHEKIAGRDVYDIHYFFLQGYKFKKEVVEERTGLKVGEYIEFLIKFIDEKVTDNILNEDLNALLPNNHFQKIRKNLKQEVLMFLRNTNN